ncbi:TetR/AcrR family transcriptional regulator [Actinoplanes sp. TBRC 11911]|uniref:TetR family transcriptional regulator n=1 Tax=Actinoplanes sp. TBRC 11911 TaxID=2729386 RepID=UPI00145DDA3A|nr:TetR family transcriptional regulator [Actinoplanes sp. TBRC 11911]NMO51456.1 TetR/AcrR family transcriptional regulator [Actinoplanes sp. TBRC 11911]
MQRARSAEAKQQREQAILAAARELAVARSVREVTLTDVAAVVGMHTSAMLRYFETREQIFLALTVEGWVEWSAWLRPNLTSDHDAAAVIAQSLAARPLFCDLLAQAPMNLERNVSLKSVYESKVAILEQVGLITHHLENVLDITEQQALDLASTATSMAGALWQMSVKPGTMLAELYTAHPELRAGVEVGPWLSRIIATMIDGMRHRN